MVHFLSEKKLKKEKAIQNFALKNCYMEFLKFILALIFTYSSIFTFILNNVIWFWKNESFINNTLLYFFE